MKVRGYGRTTNEALEDARRVFLQVTVGDPRPWVESYQSYYVSEKAQFLVECELTMEFFLRVGDDAL